jgi:hypothetical protein
VASQSKQHKAASATALQAYLHQVLCGIFDALHDCQADHVVNERSLRARNLEEFCTNTCSLAELRL